LLLRVKKGETMKYLAAIVLSTVSLLAFGAGAAQADEMKVGLLRCDVSAGLGLIITSSKSMGCVFHASRGRWEHYQGTIRKFGIDIGATTAGVLVWEVFAPTAGRLRGALTGDYVGVDASATIGAGIGANALVGGFDRSITLQPLSVEAQAGLALAAGVASLTLERTR
jgi:hypothetical protein